MKNAEILPRLLTDRSGVAFTLVSGQRDVDCIVSIDALSECFWLPSNADEDRVLATFRDGYPRILALAERRLRLAPRDPLVLKAVHFQRQS